MNGQNILAKNIIMPFLCFTLLAYACLNVFAKCHVKLNSLTNSDINVISGLNSSFIFIV